MPYVTSVERRGIEKGIALGEARGRVDAGRKMVLNFLEVRFDSPPSSAIVALMNRIDDPSVLEELSRKAATVVSPHDFKRILEDKVASKGDR